MENLNKKDVAKILNEIGTMLELKGENPFKARAYYNGARTIETLSEDIHQLVETGEIGNVKGVGEALRKKITELVTTGELKYYQDLKAGIPDGLFEMLKIPGMGPKKVQAVWEKLEITTVGELEYACHENRLVELPGFGAKTQQKILDGIEFIKKYQERWRLDDIMPAADAILEYLKKHKKIIRMELAGSLRRHRETVKDVDIVASANDSESNDIMHYFVNFPQVDEIIGHGETKSSIRLETGIQVDLRVVSDEQYPYALHHFTGSKEHNTAMRGLAKEQGLKMNEYGLFREDESNVGCSDETAIFQSLGLHFIPPELRENTGEIEFAQKHELPPLLEVSDIRGVMHVHSNYSDGVPSIREWIEESKRRGFEYLGVSDHSKTAFYANGLQLDRLKKQWDEIEALREESPDFTIFQGIESDILPDGSLDYDDEILEQFDFVIASVHSNFTLTQAKQTERIVSALTNPYTTILGHPTGRLLLARDEYNVDMQAVIEAAAGNDTIIEINANPRRLDLDWRLGKFAGSKGVLTSINPDAHRLEGLDDIKYGVGIARKGWFSKSSVLNAFPAEKVNEIFHTRRKKVKA